MAKWINVDENQGQIIFFDDSSFPFGVYMDIYSKMDANALPCHWHNVIEYGLVLSGQIAMRIDDETVILDTDDCVFINSNTLHSSKQISTSEDAVVCTVSFSPNILTENKQGTVYKRYFQPVYGKMVNGFKIDRKSHIGCRIYDMLCSFTQLNKDSFGYELTVISMISDIWLETLKYINDNVPVYDCKKRISSNQKDTIKLLLVYIQENYNKNISIDTLSNYSHISRSECFRCFKQYTGRTPFDYINDYRLQRAEFLLRTTALSILDICLSCGFSSQSYFGKLFKQKYSVPPSKYRKGDNF